MISMLNFSNASYQKSAHELRDLPEDDGYEIAFAGRSNTGKSSVINTLCRRRRLAKTSRTPGRTQQIVIFDLDETHRLIDLPGFGYAKVPKKLRAHWDRLLPRYLEQRQSLIGMVLVADARHPLKPQELGILKWCGEARVEVRLVLNKSDKLSRSQAHKMLHLAEQNFAEMRASGAVKLFSAHTKDGRAELEEALIGWYAEAAD